MPAPALRIPVELDTAALKRQLDEGASKVGEAVTKIGRNLGTLNQVVAAQVGPAAGKVLESVATNLAQNSPKLVAQSAIIATKVAAPWGYAMAQAMITPTTVAFAALGVALKAVGDVIDGTREQMAEMLEVAGKARDLQVSPEFLQSMRLAARGSEEAKEGLEGLLASFDKINRPKLQDNSIVSAADEFKRAFTEADKAMLNALETLSAFGETKAVVLFKDADTQEKKLRAMLQAVSDLFRIGQSVEALNLAEKSGSAKFADDLRKGKIELDAIVQELEKLDAGKRTGIFSNETVRQVEELDKRLKAAKAEIDNNLKPSFESLARLSLQVKTIWVDIVEAIAKASANIPKAFDEAQRERGRREAVEAQSDVTGPTAINPRVEALRRRLRDQGRLGAATPATFEERFGASEFVGPVPPATVTTALPRPRPLIEPEKAKKEAIETTDRYQTATDAIEKRTAVLEEEANTIDQGTVARNKARISTELLTVASQVYGTVSDQQRADIEKLATAYGNAAAKVEQARAPLASFARESANIGRQLNQFAETALSGFTNELAAVASGSAKAEEAFKKLADSIIQDLLRIAIRASITGPIARQLNTLFPVGGGATVPALMAGGPVASGSPYLVGEGGPELFVPNNAGMVVPNNMLRGGGGAVQQTVVINDYSGQAQVKQTQSPQGGGVEVFIPAIEQMLASGVTRGRGALSKSVDARTRGTNLYG